MLVKGENNLLYDAGINIMELNNFPHNNQWQITGRAMDAGVDPRGV